MDEEQLRRESAEIERLLDEVRALVPGPAWERVEGVIGRVLRLYGAGLAHALAHARAAATPAELDERIAGDDLLASLLVLHDLHPLSLEERVRRALVIVRAELGLADDELVLVQVGGERIELRAAGPLGGGAMASRAAEGAIRRAIESIAPEAGAVAITGIPAAPDPSLVQLRRREVR